MTIRKIVSWAAVILWMAIIFKLSGQIAEESNQLSTGIVELMIRVIGKLADHIHLDMDSIHHLVRKNAHFIAYLVLGVLAANAFGQSGLHGYKKLFAALGICILYAASDEVHQLYVPGRSGEVRDVLIDSTGACTGIGVYLIFKWICRKRKYAPKQKHMV